MRSLYFVLLLLPLMTTACVSKSSYDGKISEINQLNTEISANADDYRELSLQYEAISKTNIKLNEKLANTLAAKTDSSQQLVQAQAEITRTQRIYENKLTEKSRDLKGKDQQIGQLQNRITDLQLENDDQKRQLEEQWIAREARIAKIKSTYDQLVNMMEDEIKKGEIAISELQGQLTVNLVNRILFDSGKAEIKKQGFAVLKKVGAILNNVQDKMIQIEGHTDSNPVSGTKSAYASNWELSVARALSVVHFLQEKAHISGEKLIASGFSKYQPLADNTTAEGRAQNRRIQIVLVPLKNKAE